MTEPYLNKSFKHFEIFPRKISLKYAVYNITFTDFDKAWKNEKLFIDYINFYQ